MQLRCLNCLNNTLNTHSGIRHFLNAFQTTSPYTKLIRLVTETSTSLTSRLTVSVSTILARVTFHETLNLFETKCRKHLVLKTNPSLDFDFINEVIKIIEFIFIYVYKCIQIENPTENFYNENETGLIGGQLLDHSFNRMPLQNLFNKYDFLNSKSDATIQFRHVLAQLEHFKFFVNLILVWAYIHDHIQYLLSSQSCVYLSRLIELLLNELFVSNRNSTSRQIALDYLLVNSNLAKCMFNVMLPPDANKSVDFYIMRSKQGSSVSEKPADINRFYSPVILKVALYVKLGQLSDTLEFNLNRLVPFIKSRDLENMLSKRDSINLLNAFLDSANVIQSIELMLNIESPITQGKFLWLFCVILTKD